MNTATKTQNKWYNNGAIIVLLFFFFAPIGIYGMLKRKSADWKKIVYILGGLGLFFFQIISLIGIVVALNMDYYENGNKYYEKGEYELALKDLTKVNKGDKNYLQAQQLIEKIKQEIEVRKEYEKKLVEEQSQLAKKELEEKLSSLVLFQQEWADSILKSESQPGNRHFVKHKLSLPDTILFEYTEGVTKNGFNENLKIDTLVYREHYQKELIKKLGNEYSDIKTFISFIPNNNVDYEKIVSDNIKKEERKEKILRQFSAWDGSHSKLKRIIKANMNDPKSFDHVETTYSDKGNYILIYMKFRGTNAFGAKVIQSVTAKADIDGNIISVNE